MVTNVIQAAYALIGGLGVATQRERTRAVANAIAWLEHDATPHPHVATLRRLWSDPTGPQQYHIERAIRHLTPLALYPIQPRCLLTQGRGIFLSCVYPSLT